MGVLHGQRHHVLVGVAKRVGKLVMKSNEDDHIARRPGLPEQALEGEGGRTG